MNRHVNLVLAAWATGNVIIFWGSSPIMVALNAWACGMLLGLDTRGGAR